MNAANAPPSDPKPTLLTRWTSAALIPFLVTAGTLLYVWPAETEARFAWTINPRMTPLLMGAGFFSGAYFFLRAALADRWERIAAGFLPIAGYTWLSATYTLLHWDRFNHDHVTFYAWVGLYALTPFLVPALWWIENRRHGGVGPGAHAGARIPPLARGGLALTGFTLVLVGAILFLAPSLLIPVWPWTLSALTARVVGSWFVLSGLVDLNVARLRLWERARRVLETQLIAIALMLVGVVRAWSDFDSANPLTYVFVGGLLVILAGLLILTWNRSRAQA